MGQRVGINYIVTQKLLLSWASKVFVPSDGPIKSSLFKKKKKREETPHLLIEVAIGILTIWVLPVLTNPLPFSSLSRLKWGLTCSWIARGSSLLEVLGSSNWRFQVCLQWPSKPNWRTCLTSMGGVASF